jgi:hypothetical protein
MRGFDRAAVERHLRRLDERALVALVDDLWAARGYQTTRDGSSVVATRDGESVRLRVVGSGSWRPGHRHVVADDADVVVAGTSAGVTAPGADVVDASDLADVLAYGVERASAHELCARHLGAPPDRLSPPLAERSVRRVGAAARRGLPVAAVGILVLAVAVTVGGSLVGSSDPTDPPVTPAAPATEPPPLPPAGDGPPPGVGDDGITDLDALADAHAEAVGERSHTIWYDRSQPRNLDPNETRVRRDVDITAADDRYLVETTEVVSGNETYLGAVYRDGGVIYTADWNETSRRHERVLRLDWRNVLVPTAPDLRENLVGRYLSTPRTTVTGTTERDGVTVYRVVGRGAPNSSSLGEVRDYSVVALVDSRGLVHDLTVRYASVLSDREYRITVEITYGRIGETTVTPPAWFENRTRSEQDPSGANRPL